MGKHKEFLQSVGIGADDSHLAQVAEWRAIYECEGPDNYERRVLVSRDTGRASAVGHGESAHDLRRKFSFRAHVLACKKWAGLFFNERTGLRLQEQCGVAAGDGSRDSSGAGGLPAAQNGQSAQIGQSGESAQSGGAGGKGGIGSAGEASKAGETLDTAGSTRITSAGEIAGINHAASTAGTVKLGEATSADPATGILRGAPELAFLEQHYEKAGVWAMLESNFPEMFGMGTVAVVTEFTPEFGIVHKWYGPEAILPVEVCQGQLRSVVFVSEFESGGERFTLYNAHLEKRGLKTLAQGRRGVWALASGNGYIIRNIIRAQNGKEVSCERFGIEAEYESEHRLFAVFRPFNRRVRGFSSGLGVPVYHDAQDMIVEIDELYDIKHDDTQKSRRNIFIDKDVLTYDARGRANIPQHLWGTVVSTQALDGRGGELKSHFITEFAPDPKMELYSAELQAALNRFSDAVGLGSDAFKLERGQIATATQIISENQEKYANLKKHLSVISSEFTALNRAIVSVARQHLGAELDPEIPIGFFVQDSVLVDDETSREIALREVSAGLRSRESYLAEFRGLGGAELEQELARLLQKAVPPGDPEPDSGSAASSALQ